MSELRRRVTFRMPRGPFEEYGVGSLDKNIGKTIPVHGVGRGEITGVEYKDGDALVTIELEEASS